jgi:hypothetical protein
MVAAAITNAKRQVTALPASPLITSGVTIPARLTATSPSAIATARRGPCASASAAQTRINANVARHPMNNAARIVTAGVLP